MLLFVFLEEISYGQRIFHFITPAEWRPLNVQGELNLHNIATGLTNRVFSAAVIAAGAFVPVAAAAWNRIDYAFKRLRVSPPGRLEMLVFAGAAVYTTPCGFNLSSLDEQELLSYAVLVLFAALAVRAVILSRRRGGVELVLAVFVGVLIAVKLLINVLQSRWPVGNYPEEVKELLFAIGFFIYSITLLRSTRHRASTTRSVVNPLSPG
jgi:hypothetical protein